jgi:hypothetical protein
MPTNFNKYVPATIQSRIEVAAPTGTFTIGETVGNNAVQGSATALGVLKAVELNGANTVLVIDNISGTALFADAATVTGYTSTATAVVDTIADIGSETINGQNVYSTPGGLVTKKVTGTRVRKETLIASRGFAAKQAA